MFHYVLKGLTHRNTSLCYVIVSSYWFYQHDDDGQIHELILNIWSPKSCSSKMPEEQPGFVTTDKQLTASERASITSWQADSASAARPDPISHGGKRRSERPPAEVQKQQSDKHDAQKHPAADEETDGEETTDMLTMLMLVRHC